MKIDKNSYVSIDYLIHLGDNETYPPSGQPEEISFCLGWGVMPAKLEEAMLGLEEKDHKHLHLTPVQAYGEVDLDLIMDVPRSDFAPDLELRPGLVFETEGEEGQPVYFIVKEVHPDSVVIDFNHPLAGRELEVSFTVRQVREATPEDLKEYHSCFACADGGPHTH
jgi:FKBP-type peptidyl-prolyl cis-trans isomerase SlyD